MLMSTSKIRMFKLSIIALFLAFSGWKSNFEGGDISLARKSYLSENPVDIWGGFSLFFYGNIPEFVLHWGAILYIGQLSLTYIGLLIFSTTLNLENKISRYLFYFTSYSALAFSTSLTRDSTMTAFLILGSSLLSLNSKKKSQEYLRVFLGVALICVGFSFRPWLSICGFLIYLIFKSKNYLYLNYFLALFLILTPFLLDQISYFTKDIERVHPELQVIVLDLSTLSCQTSNKELSNKVVEIIKTIDPKSFKHNSLCANLKWSTWQSVGKWDYEAIEKSKIDTLSESINENGNDLIRLSGNLSQADFSDIRINWMKVIIENPKDYLQIKIYQAMQLGIAGDFFTIIPRNILESDKNLLQIIEPIVYLPYNFIISFHMLSPFVSFLISALVIIVSLRKKLIEEVFMDRSLFLIYTFLFLWLGISTLAFIGDNGRYVYLSSLIYNLALISKLHKFQIK